jgi:hypothetical protein
MPTKKPSPGQRGFALFAATPKIPDGYYSGDKPNPSLRAFVEQNAALYDPESDDYDIPAFNQPLLATGQVDHHMAARLIHRCGAAAL